MEHKATVLGIMSGSSLDGLDVCRAIFEYRGNLWRYEILETSTIHIPNELTEKLSKSHLLQEKQLKELDIEYGEFIGNVVKEFTKKTDLIGLHGHTVRHAPSQMISLQIGDAQSIARITKTKTIGNFRMADILFGGQGAPLVPMGEKHLFTEYKNFLNLGGICNSSHDLGDQWIAGDIGPFNQVFNFYANKLGEVYDSEGLMASQGKVLGSLIDNWNSLEFFRYSFPKSLGNDWVQSCFFRHNSNPFDVLASFAEFISSQISKQLKRIGNEEVFVTGGGTFNRFVFDQIQDKYDGTLIVPERKIVEYKEALIFGFLGLLRSLGLPNVISSCTGATKDSCGGDVFTA